jgi:hypothetical protein
LVRRHSAAYFGLLAYDHGLEDAWVAKRERTRDSGIPLRKRNLPERRGKFVQVVPNLVDGAMLRFREGAGLVKRICGLSVGPFV